MKLSVRWATLGAVILWGILPPCNASDCNLNGIDDAEEIAAGDSPDCDGDGVPDGCEIVELLTGGTGRQLPIESTPAAIVAGDFDADGRLDLAALQRENETLVYWINRPGGEFEPGVELSMCESASLMVAVDVDGDGIDEVAMGCRAEGRLQIFSPQAEEELSSVPLDGIPTALVTSDIDRDGHVDIVVATLEDIIFVNNIGDGTFRHASFGGFAGTMHPDALVATDIDGDTRVDVVFANSAEDSVTVLYGGAGILVDATDVLAGVGDGPAGIIAADLENDGDVDLVTVNLGSRDVTVLRQDRHRTFTAVPVHIFEGLEPQVIAAGDLNGDGLPDLALGGWFPGFEENAWWIVRTLVGVPGGGFTGAEDFFGGVGPGGAERSPVLIVDLFEEGQPQIVTASPGSSELDIFVVENEGGGGPEGCEIFRRGDVDADGALNVTDVVLILSELFLAAGRAPCAKSADTNDSGDLDLTDAVYLLNYLFLAGRAPEEPFPVCGLDPTFDELPCDSFAACEEP